MISGEVGRDAGSLNVSSTSTSMLNIPLTVGEPFVLQERLAPDSSFRLRCEWQQRTVSCAQILLGVGKRRRWGEKEEEKVVEKEGEGERKREEGEGEENEDI